MIIKEKGTPETTGARAGESQERTFIPEANEGGGGQDQGVAGGIQSKPGNRKKTDNLFCI